MKKYFCMMLTVVLLMVTMLHMGAPAGAQASEDNLFDMVFSLESIELTKSSQIHGSVGTNITQSNGVTFEWSTRIKGDLLIGPGAEWPFVVTGSNMRNNVEGNIANLEAARSYPLPDFPEFPQGLPQRADFKTPWVQGEYYEISQDGQYDLIEVTSNRTLVIDLNNETRILRVKHLNIQQGHIELKNKGEDSQLILYVEETFALNGSSTINDKGHYNDVIMYYAGNSMQVAGNTSFVGCLYAKKADITITGSGGIKGNVITGGQNFSVTGNAEANVRAVYAPNAHLYLEGSGRIRGTAIAKSMALIGDALIFYSDAMDMHFFEKVGLISDPGAPPPTNMSKIRNVYFTTVADMERVDIVKFDGSIAEEYQVVNAKISVDVLEELSSMQLTVEGVTDGLSYIGSMKALNEKGDEFNFTQTGDVFTFEGALAPGEYEIFFDVEVYDIDTNRNIELTQIKVKTQDITEIYTDEPDDESDVFLNNELQMLLHDINITFDASRDPDSADTVNVDILYEGDDILVQQYRLGEDGDWQDYVDVLAITENITIYARAGIIGVSGEVVLTQAVSHTIDYIISEQGPDTIGIDMLANVSAYSGNKSAAAPVFFVGDDIVVPFHIVLEPIQGSRDMTLELHLNQGKDNAKLMFYEYFNIETITENTTVTLSEDYDQIIDLEQNMLIHQLDIRGEGEEGEFVEIEACEFVFEVRINLNEQQINEQQIGRLQDEKQLTLENDIKLSYINDEGVLIIIEESLDVEITFHPTPQGS